MRSFFALGTGCLVLAVSLVACGDVSDSDNGETSPALVTSFVTSTTSEVTSSASSSETTPAPPEPLETPSEAPSEVPSEVPAAPAAVPVDEPEEPETPQQPAQFFAPAPQPAEEAPAAASYGSCAEARDAGAAPLYAGDPGYSSKLDRDGDGIACET